MTEREIPAAGSTVRCAVSERPEWDDVMLDLYRQHVIGLGIAVQSATRKVHGANVRAGWWHDIHSGRPQNRNVFEMLALVHSELSEATEAHRKGLADDKLTDRPGIEVELADAVIRILDLAGAMDLDLGGAIRDKLLFNLSREDHRPENRRLPGGKAA